MRGGVNFAIPGARKISSGEGGEAPLRDQSHRIDGSIDIAMDPRVTLVLGMLRQGLGDRILLRDLARAVNLSVSRLRELFKKDTGQPPAEYLKNLRMQRAGHLLRSTFLPVKEIAYVTGLKDVSGFVRAFKRYYGLTPSAFRAQNASCAERLHPRVGE